MSKTLTTNENKQSDGKDEPVTSKLNTHKSQIYTCYLVNIKKVI